MIINAGRGIVSVMAVLGDTQLHVVTPEGKKRKKQQLYKLQKLYNKDTQSLRHGLLDGIKICIELDRDALGITFLSPKALKFRKR